MARILRAKLNPVDGFENDTCIFVKYHPWVKLNKMYFDIIDAHKEFKWVKRNPECPVIAISKTAETYLKENFKNPIVFIPQHHCNFRRVKRNREEVRVAGFCGTEHTFKPFEQEIREKLSKIGMELNFYHSYNNYHDVVRFYQTIDIQIIWRNTGYLDVLSNPLKLSNAGSFKIPTVSFPETNFVVEYDKCFLPATSIDDLIDKVKELRDDNNLYLNISEAAEKRAENYHISNVAKIYDLLSSS